MHDFNSVLIIEDDPGDLRLVQEYLKDRFGAGCVVRAASTLQMGLQALAAEPCDVVLLDLGLPDSIGLETYFAINAAAPEVPVVILTGDDSEQMAETALQGGAEDFLAKRHADSLALVRAMRHAVQRRLLTQRLRSSEALYRAIVQTAEEALLLVDGQACIAYANPRLTAMRGLPDDGVEAGSSNLLDLLSSDSADTARRLLSGKGGERRTGELRLLHADGRPRSTLAASGLLALAGMNASPLATAGPHWVLMLSDIDALQLAQQQLQELGARLELTVAERTRELEASNAALADFNQSVAHDLRTPLNGVLGFAALLLKDETQPLSEGQTLKLRVIEESARSMDALIEGLLRLARAGRDPCLLQPLDLGALAQGVADTLQVTDPQRVVQWDIAPQLQAHGDPQLVRALLVNLLQNAWKYSARQPVARISVGQQAADAQHPAAYFVQDNGVGFDATAAEGLFEPFQRLPTAQGFAGNGIGLATVRRIVDRHGGRIWAHSAPGQGACFYFTLDAAGSTHEDQP